MDELSIRIWLIPDEERHRLQKKKKSFQREYDLKINTNLFISLCIHTIIIFAKLYNAQIHTILPDSKYSLI